MPFFFINILFDSKTAKHLRSMGNHTSRKRRCFVTIPKLLKLQRRHYQKCLLSISFLFAPILSSCVSCLTIKATLASLLSSAPTIMPIFPQLKPILLGKTFFFHFRSFVGLVNSCQPNFQLKLSLMKIP